jgi:hypothetical protein
MTGLTPCLSAPCRPTPEEFADPIAYLKSLRRRGADRTGICVIVPPEGAFGPAGGTDSALARLGEFHILEQQIDEKGPGVWQLNFTEGSAVTGQDYIDMVSSP